jgi:hypothetical protein
MQKKSSSVRWKSTANFKGELLVTYIAFMPKPATMRMVEVSTGILRPNICRYVARLKKLGLITFQGQGYCPHTKHLAGFYITGTLDSVLLQRDLKKLWLCKVPHGFKAA